MQFADNSGRQTGTAGADRVADGAGTAIDVDLLLRQLQSLDCQERYQGKGLVDLEQIDIVQGQAGLGTDLFYGADRRIREIVGVAALGGTRHDACPRLQVVPRQRLLVGQQQHRRAVTDTGRIGSGDGAVFLKDRLERRNFIEIDLERLFIIADDRLDPAHVFQYRHDLVLTHPVPDGRLRT